MNHPEAFPAVRKTSCFRLGCQTITWDNERIEKRDHTVRAVAEAGYRGLEIGARFLDLDHPAEFKRILDENDVELVSIHTGWNPFLDTTGASDRGCGEVERAIAFARETGASFLVMSGRADVSQQLQDVAGLNAIGEACGRAGISFCYHNHWWEIQSESRLLREIQRRTDPELVGFCPDIGWIRKVTPEVDKVLDLVAPRIRMVHLKDYVADGVDVRDDETEFGEGIMDFGSVFTYLRQLPAAQLWVIAEQWKSSVNHLPPEESIRRNREFLETVITASN